MMCENVDWVAVQKVERDICLLYHQLSDYNYIEGDVYWGSVYSLPYWDFLQVRNIEPEQEAFLRDGCLVLILAMACEALEGAGFYIGDKLERCQKAVAQIHPADPTTKRLVETVSDTLDIVPLALEAEANNRAFNEPSTLPSTQWVHREYVEGYFRGMIRQFYSNP